MVNIAAVCEADSNVWPRRPSGSATAADAYRDYRELLQRKDIDAVVIASPDHWHAVQTVHACQAGKHVYVEKPASCTVAEGRAMVAAARKHNRVVQVGSQARSAEPAHQVCTYIRNGMLGKVAKVTCWHTPNPDGRRRPEPPPPPELDWDLWLGPLPLAAVRARRLSSGQLPLDDGVGRRRDPRPRGPRDERHPVVPGRRPPDAGHDRGHRRSAGPRASGTARRR